MSSALGPNGSTSAWRRIRALVLQRDAGKGCRAHREGWCARPGVKAHVCTDRQQQVHHTRGRAAGDDMRHLVASCAPCNNAIGDPTKHGDPPGRSVTKW